MRSEEGLILAGGAGRRMLGRDKGRMPYKGRPLVEYPVAAMRAHGLRITICCNRSQFYYRTLADRLISDRSSGYPGPLVALSEAMLHFKSSHCVITPCDTPQFDAGHLETLLKSSRQHPEHWIVAVSGDGRHPLHAVFPTGHTERLQAMVAEGEKRMMRALQQFPYKEVHLPADALINVNHLAALTT